VTQRWWIAGTEIGKKREKKTKPRTSVDKELFLLTISSFMLKLSDY
jgi:hypothetical protein